MSANLPLPTKKDDFRLIFRTVRLVLSIPVYAFLAVLVAFISLTLFTISQNPQFVYSTVLVSSLPLENRLVIFLELFPFIGTFYSLYAGIMMVFLALFIGVNISLVVYHFLEHDFSASSSGGSFLGIVFGILGAGCAACGSVLLLGILSLFGAGSLVLLLPFEGLEISFLAVIVLFLSTYWLADGMRGGEIAGCPVDL